MRDSDATHVRICVATYKRPAGLKALLDSFDAIRVPDGVIVSIGIVDNAPDAPAEKTLGPVAALSRFPCTYVMEPVRGVVAARNRSLDLAPDHADFMAFVDDDETVSPGWLTAHLATLDETEAEASQGPVSPVYAVEPPGWAVKSGLFRLGPFDNGAPLHFAATNNSMVRADFVRRHALRFDMAFNFTGGEDEDFFTTLRQEGGRIVAAAEAEVFDHIPANRLTEEWIYRRAERMGNTLGRIALKSGTGRPLRIAKGIGAVLKGMLQAATLGLLSKTQRVRGIMECRRGRGMIAAFLGRDIEEYGEAAVRSDRATGTGHA